MHTISVNGSRLVVYHQRTFEQIHDKPHIARWVGIDDGGAPLDRWAVYYLLGRQSRVSCNLHETLAGAIRQVNYVAGVNARSPRFITRRNNATRPI